MEEMRYVEEEKELVDVLPGGSQLRDSKMKKIRSCLEQDVIDLWELRELSLTNGGLVNGTSTKTADPCRHTRCVLLTHIPFD